MNFLKLKFNIFQQRGWLYVLLLLTVLSYFLWLNATPGFSDPDAFYHAKITQLIKANGPVKNFKWLPFTTLNELYTDHQLLYHLLLLPLFCCLKPLLAIKLGTVIFAALMILFFQWLLDKFKIKYALAYTFILLTAYQFIFRINLTKTSALSLIFLLAFIYLIFNYSGRWSWKLFILSAAYVWLYGGWAISLGVGLIYWLTKGIKNWQQNYLAQQKTGWRYLRSSLFNLPQLKLVANFTGGLLSGLVVNPYFPINLKFYWQQTFQIGLLNHKNMVEVGSEWYGIALFDLIRHNVLIFILWLAAWLIFFIYLNRQDERRWSLLITNFIFLALTLKAKRNFEYLIPFMVLFSALVINDLMEIKTWQEIKQISQKYLWHSRTALYALGAGLLVYLPILWQGNFKALPRALRHNYSFNQFAGITSWLQAHSQAGEIIFHDRWDDWPVFFYHNSYNRYIIGLDPRFMYFKNKDKYLLWQKIVKAEVKKPCGPIKQNFKANYIFVKSDNLKFRYNLATDHDCQLAYQDKDGQIYKITNF